ncbi:MAG: hypothetical protein MUF08_00590 [Burkholderiaceae bacterium]|jgi:hypothetical protein|nr:hypothetical protein [Burkholderiaceae bacterium]
MTTQDGIRIEAMLRRLAMSATAFDDVLAYLQTEVAAGTAIATVASLMRRALSAEVDLALTSVSVVHEHVFTDTDDDSEPGERLQCMRISLQSLVHVAREVREVFVQLPLHLHGHVGSPVAPVAARLAGMRVLATQLEDEIVVAERILEHVA